MILGWQAGHSVGRYVLLELFVPWPALHHAREALRVYTERETRARDAFGTEGMRRMKYGLQSAVKEDGDCELRVWPIGKGGLPRAWEDRDGVWREALTDLKRFVGAELCCCTRLIWQPGGQPLERVRTVPSLADRQGFWGWKRGEREPTERRIRDLNRELGAQLLVSPPRLTNPGLGVP
jgi:hypothetical protein